MSETRQKRRDSTSSARESSRWRRTVPSTSRSHGRRRTTPRMPAKITSRNSCTCSGSSSTRRAMSSTTDDSKSKCAVSPRELRRVPQGASRDPWRAAQRVQIRHRWRRHWARDACLQSPPCPERQHQQQPRSRHRHRLRNSSRRLQARREARVRWEVQFQGRRRRLQGSDLHPCRWLRNCD